MTWGLRDPARGLDQLCAAVLAACGSRPQPAGVPGWMLLSEATVSGPASGGRYDDSSGAASSEGSEAERTRLIALVDLARGGDAEAFGQLYDHYQAGVYRFLFYRTRSQAVAEDLTSETFLRALRNMSGFRWQGKDFGAWLMTIARNLTTDHFKAGRTRLELSTDDLSERQATGQSPEDLALAALTNDVLRDSLAKLPSEQHECIVLRFLNGYSIAETAKSMSRSEGAIKQLQLRAVRNLARLVPEELR
jgi:RNA polymerase sigma-70 factor (ECF subfamily)